MNPVTVAYLLYTIIFTIIYYYNKKDNNYINANRFILALGASLWLLSNLFHSFSIFYVGMAWQYLAFSNQAESGFFFLKILLITTFIILGMCNFNRNFRNNRIGNVFCYCCVSF